MQTELYERNRNIGFGCCIPPVNIYDEKLTNTKHGSFMSASPLAYQLNPLGFNFEIETNIEKMNEFAKISQHCSVQLPFHFFHSNC